MKSASQFFCDKMKKKRKKINESCLGFSIPHCLPHCLHRHAGTRWKGQKRHFLASAAVGGTGAWCFRHCFLPQRAGVQKSQSVTAASTGALPPSTSSSSKTGIPPSSPHHPLSEVWLSQLLLCCMHPILGQRECQGEAPVLATSVWCTPKVCEAGPHP